MIQPANPPPPGCPQGWPIKLTAASGIQIVYGPPHSRQPPGVDKFRGIGVKMRKIANWSDPNLPDHESSWAGLYDQKLFDLYYPFSIFNHQKQQEEQMVLNLPMMGMPPREPTAEFMESVRSGEVFVDWFKYAYVFKATDFPRGTVQIGETRGLTDSIGDDVVIRLPRWPGTSGASLPSLYRDTESEYGFEFRTALPDNDGGHDPANMNLDNLYFIQLLPNELPSYHFWIASNDTPNRPHLPGVRVQADSKGSAHWEALEASVLQSMRPSPHPAQSSPGSDEAGENAKRRSPSPPQSPPKSKAFKMSKIAGPASVVKHRKSNGAFRKRRNKGGRKAKANTEMYVEAVRLLR